jgi:predicted acylesterase/phospholipase RssA
MNYLVSTGGGAKGAFGAGVMHAMMEKNVQFEALYGASIGGVNSLLYGLSYDLPQIWRKYFKLDNMILVMLEDILMNKSSVYDAITMRKVFKTLFQNFKISYLRPEINIVSSDLRTGTCYTFLPDDDCLTAALATSAFPVIFPPVMYKEMILVDGGVTNNVPLPDYHILTPNDTTTVIIMGSKTPLKEPNFGHLSGSKRKVAEALYSWECYANRETINELNSWHEDIWGKLTIISCEKYDSVWAFDFSKTEQLIEYGYTEGMSAISSFSLCER